VKKTVSIILAIILLTAIHGRAYAGVGTTFQTTYETGFDAGTGTGTQFTTNSISAAVSEGTGSLTFGTTSILATVLNDGTIDPGEECDNGPANSDTTPNACRTNGLEAYCGDGIKDTGEECDGSIGILQCKSIGNYISGTVNSCTSSCQYNRTLCVPPPVAGGSSGSGGSGGSGSGGGPVGPSPVHEAPPEAVCGNLVAEGNEQCDDGNLLNGDGCNESCQSEILDVCGNNIMETGEQCDDGNTFNGDGCNSVCIIETGVRITITVYPEKRLPSSGNWQNSYAVNITNRTNGESVYRGNLETNSQGTGSIVIPSISDGNYDIALKGISHLRVIIPNVSINADAQVNATDRIIFAGDVQGDNFINALDISVVVSHLYSGNVVSDLNRDSIVNALDVSILLSNLYKGGQ
jgi:cysteine-rich repeat protein